MEFSAKQIADLIGGRIEGNENTIVNSFAKIEEGHKGAISFLSNPKYTHYLYNTESSVVLVNDGEEQDAYIIGVDEPVQEFMGKVIAIVHRYDDVEEKWVVCPENQYFTQEEIMRLVNFQEQYFDSILITTELTQKEE